jgi:hypothetical protein
MLTWVRFGMTRDASMEITTARCIRGCRDPYRAAVCDARLASDANLPQFLV